MVSLPQKDLAAHLTGSATFVEDLNAVGQLHIGFLRSPFPHARIAGISTRRIKQCDDPVAVYTGADLRRLLAPNDWREFPLAESEAAYQGHPVAAVVVAKRSSLEDCLERIEVGYEPLPAVSDLHEAVGAKETWLSGASSNVIFDQTLRAGRPDDAARKSPHTIRLNLRIPRWSPFPLEGRGILVEYGPHDAVVYASTQAPHVLQHFLVNSAVRPIPVRVIQAAVGGAFGGKMFPYPEDLVSYLIAIELRRSVKWTSLPEEKLLTLTHRPDQKHEVRVGFDSSGRILALEDRALVDVGAYLGGPSSAPLQQPGVEGRRGLTAIDQTAGMITGPYDIKDVYIRVRAVATNTVPAGPARGSGNMIATFILERALNVIARRLCLNQFDVRRVNLIEGASGERSMPFGSSIPHFRFLELLELARTSKATRSLISAASRGGPQSLMGFGVSFYLAESAPPSAETVRLEFGSRGVARLSVSVAPTGTGSERTLAAIVGRRLRIPLSAVEVRAGDTGTSPKGIGTTSSRSIVYAGSAALVACELLVEKMRKRLEDSARLAPVRVTFGGGKFHLDHGEGRRETLDILEAFHELNERISVDATYRSETSTFSAGCHISLVRVDRETGLASVVRHLTFDDFGTVLDRSAIESQLEGAAVQSIGEALREDVRYDRGARLENSFLIPTMIDAPKFSHTIVHLTRSQHLHGGRGAGEAGRIGSMPAIANALESAISKANENAFVSSMPVGSDSISALMKFS